MPPVSQRSAALQYLQSAPRRQHATKSADTYTVFGVVRGRRSGFIIRDARIEVWRAGSVADGKLGWRNRAVLSTDPWGRYSFVIAKPTGVRPKHSVRIRITAPGYQPVDILHKPTRMGGKIVNHEQVDIFMPRVPFHGSGGGGGGGIRRKTYPVVLTQPDQPDLPGLNPMPIPSPDIDISRPDVDQPSGTDDPTRDPPDVIEIPSGTPFTPYNPDYTPFAPQTDDPSIRDIDHQSSASSWGPARPGNTIVQVEPGSSIPAPGSFAVNAPDANAPFDPSGGGGPTRGNAPTASGSGPSGGGGGMSSSGSGGMSSPPSMRGTDLGSLGDLGLLLVHTARQRMR